MSAQGILKINGETVEATHFAYDGCHKIHLIGTQAMREEMNDYGYTGRDILPVSELKRVWEETCFLRFISWADLALPNVIDQGYEAEPVIEWIAA